MSKRIDEMEDEDLPIQTVGSQRRLPDSGSSSPLPEPIPHPTLVAPYSPPISSMSSQAASLDGRAHSSPSVTSLTIPVSVHSGRASSAGIRTVVTSPRMYSILKLVVYFSDDSYN